ncbi:3-deoxy-manno-octulosonate cytidylyltransferase [Psychroflexus planctonicus]|uniref:3-deoxy-manno-octulosonate cytidylyltransferase n=1 Tax=Psychroflexus planctonicus TaxID=1526575 RepID=A0ABQ1SGX9_9FLAO|nr:3-deoxy-manno-octulosonate cytidylyltransferase [Psychroflexus planctonicus]GGE31218.1 3-deoxy-manno-octulosonate cytidylyltransferase [Psychroflexus planctonicus]
MNIIAMIPARFEASRFPGKLLKDLAGKPVIVRTYEAALHSSLFDEVYIVTDSDEIYNTIEAINGKVILSKKEHECGSDRIAEAVEHIDADIVVNVQGDEPFINEKALSKLLEVFKHDEQNQIDLASLKTRLTKTEAIANPNNVKVITDLNDFALYFSRSPIPFHRDESVEVKYFKHVGIYAFRKKALLDFYHTPMSPLEAAEKIECIRHLENGKTIKMVETDQVSIGIDTPEDLEEARKFF